MTDNLEQGEHEGRLVRVADLGWHQDTYQGETKPKAKKAALGIEIVGKDVEINGQTYPRMLWTKPFNVFPSLTEMGKEMEFYSAFDTHAEPGQKADWESQLGKPCNVVVKHVEKGGNTYDNIERLAPIPSKYHDKVEKNRLEAHAWNDKARENLFGLARWIYERRLDQQEAEDNTSEPSDDFDDDIPF